MDGVARCAKADLHLGADWKKVNRSPQSIDKLAGDDGAVVPYRIKAEAFGDDHPGPAEETSAGVNRIHNGNLSRFPANGNISDKIKEEAEQNSASSQY